MTIIYCVLNDQKQVLDTFITRQEAESFVNNIKTQQANKLLLEQKNVPEIMRSDQYSYMFSQYNNILNISSFDIINQMDQLQYPILEEREIL